MTVVAFPRLGEPASWTDWKAEASRQMRAARLALGEDLPAFAARLTDLVGWPVRPDVLERWETSNTAPADALLAAYAAARERSR